MMTTKIKLIAAVFFLLTAFIFAEEKPKLVRPAFLDKVTTPVVPVVKEEVPDKVTIPVIKSILEITVQESVKPNTNAEVMIVTDSPAINVKSQSDLFTQVKVYEVKGGDNRMFVFTGPPGKYLITATVFNNGSITEATKVITIGEPIVVKPVVPVVPPKPPTPTPGPPPVVDDNIVPVDPVNPIPKDDLWGLGEVIKAELSKIDVPVEKLNKYSDLYLDLSKRVGSKNLTIKDAYIELKDKTVLILTEEERGKLANFNKAINEKMKQVWPLNEDGVSRWLFVIGDELKKGKSKPLSISVLMIYETLDSSKKELREVETALNSPEVREYLNSHKFEWRLWDKDVVPVNVDQKWKDARSLLSAYTVPTAIVIDQNSKLVEKIEVKDTPQLLNKLKSYGGQ